MITFVSMGWPGQLGNQLFHYALLKGVAAKTGFECAIPDRFGLPYRKKQGLVELSAYHIRCRRHPPTYQPDRSQIFSAHDRSFQPEVFEVADGTDFVGLFQSYRYFEHVADELRNELRLCPPYRDEAKAVATALRKQAQGRPIVSLHVRRGDYLRNRNMRRVVCHEEYYEQAKIHFEELAPLYLVHSDDLPWCRTVFSEERHLFLDNVTHWACLDIVSQCDHHIICHSTFGWWAAWLNPSQEKIVVAPKHSTNRVPPIESPPSWKTI